MKRIKFYLGTGFAGCSYEDIFEFDDDETDEEISESLEDWKNNYLDVAWWEVGENET